jgi:large subunit ribosomal protein L19
MNLISKVEKNHLKNLPALKSGDVVRVHQKVKEGGKERIQIFEGIIIRHSGGTGAGASITVRKISYGVGVERTYPLHSPNIAKIEVIKRSKVRRAFLGYLRALRGKKARLKEREFDQFIVNVEERDLAPEELAKPEEVEENTQEAQSTDTDLNKEATKDGEEAEKAEEIEAEEVKEEGTPEDKDEKEEK